MKIIKIISSLVAWYIFAIGLFLAIVKLMPINHRYLFDAAIVACLLLAACIAYQGNFLTKSIGRMLTFLVLCILLWCSFMSFVYLGIFIYGDGL